MFCIFCILLLATKMGLHLVCIFLHPDFFGSIFQLHLFCVFLHLYLLFCFPERGTTRPHNPKALSICMVPTLGLTYINTRPTTGNRCRMKHAVFPSFE